MDLSQVLPLSLPLFILIWLGWWSVRRTWMNHEAEAYATSLVYYVSLPAIIVLGVAQQDFAQLFNGPVGVIVSTALATVLSGVLFGVVARLIKPSLTPARWVPMSFAPFWANNIYLGIPLAEAAFGPEGKSYVDSGGVYYATFLLLGTMCLQLAHRHQSSDSQPQPHEAAPAAGVAPWWMSALKKAVLNPVVLAALTGIALSFCYRHTPLGALLDWSWGRSVIDIAHRCLSMLAHMGLPLALLMVGAALARTQTPQTSTNAEQQKAFACFVIVAASSTSVEGLAGMVKFPVN